MDNNDLGEKIKMINKLIDLINQGKIKWRQSEYPYRDKNDLWTSDYDFEFITDKIKCRLSIYFATSNSSVQNLYHIIFYEKYDNEYKLVKNISNDTYDYLIEFINDNDFTNKIFNLFELIKSKIMAELNNKNNFVDFVLGELGKL